MSVLCLGSPYFLFGMGGLFSGDGWGKSCFCTIYPPPRVSLRMLFAMDSEARTGSNVSRSHVVLLIIYLSSGDKNSKTESPCYL